MFVGAAATARCLRTGVARNGMQSLRAVRAAHARKPAVVCTARYSKDAAERPGGTMHAALTEEQLKEMGFDVPTIPDTHVVRDAALCMPVECPRRCGEGMRALPQCMTRKQAEAQPSLSRRLQPVAVCQTLGGLGAPSKLPEGSRLRPLISCRTLHRSGTWPC